MFCRKIIRESHDGLSISPNYFVDAEFGGGASRNSPDMAHIRKLTLASHTASTRTTQPKGFLGSFDIRTDGHQVGRSFFC